MSGKPSPLYFAGAMLDDHPYRECVALVASQNPLDTSGAAGKRLLLVVASEPVLSAQLEQLWKAAQPSVTSSVGLEAWGD
ncbi:MAG: hypothetical protein FRX49_04015 [Trebouxia sp. A1-2]|nr:MAG: hypothetical protein FRX49_04015 [Trebouxia sp. A1-2]